jgi:hypothetical protein
MRSDTATTWGGGVDGAVWRLDTGGTTVVNQVQRAFNGYGQATQEWQSHAGAVNTSTTPSVQYGYGALGSGDHNSNQSRLTSITYPNGRVLTYNYSPGLADAISRLSSISDTGATLESYSYLGLDTVVKRAHPQPNVGKNGKNGVSSFSRWRARLAGKKKGRTRGRSSQ